MVSKILNFINNDDWVNAIKNANDIFDPLYEGKNIFHFACMRGKKSVINEIIALKSIKIILSDDNGNTGAHLLAINGWFDILLDVLNLEPLFMTIQNYNKDTIFILLLEVPDVLEKTIDIISNKKMDKYLHMSIDSSCIYGVIHTFDTFNKPNNSDIYKKNEEIYYNILKKISQLDININSKNNTPLLNAVVFNKNDKLIIFILDNFKNLDINVSSSYNVTALSYLIIDKREKLANVLIDRGIDINKCDSEKLWLPVKLAIKYKCFSVLQKLIDTNKINYDAQDETLNTPIFYLINLVSVSSKNTELRQYLETFIEKSNVNIKNNMGISPIHLLMKFKLWKDYKHLLKKIDIYSPDITNNNPIKYVDSEELHDMFNVVHTLNITQDTIILPDTIKNSDDFGIFGSYMYQYITYLLYLLDRYPQLDMLLQTFSNDKYYFDKYYIELHGGNISRSFYKLKTFMSKSKYIFEPGWIVWSSKTTYYIDNNMEMYIKKFLLSNRRILAFPITICNDNIYHANMGIYDKKRNVLMRFEPYGDWDLHDMFLLDNKLITLFKKCLSGKMIDSLVFLRPHEYLQNVNFQQSSLGDKEQNLGDPGGYCLAWCLWFLELKLLNPDIDEKNIVDIAMNKILLPSNKKNPILDNIRAYAKYIDQQKNIILEKIGMPKHTFYNMIIDENIYSIFPKYVQEHCLHRMN